MKQEAPTSISRSSSLKTSNDLEGRSDRYNGRKVYGLLKNAGFSNIGSYNLTIDTISKDFQTRNNIFKSVLVWRLNYIKKECNDTKIVKSQNMMKIAAYNFENPDFYYCYTSPIFWGINK